MLDIISGKSRYIIYTIICIVLLPLDFENLALAEVFGQPVFYQQEAPNSGISSIAEQASKHDPLGSLSKAGFVTKSTLSHTKSSTL